MLEMSNEEEFSKKYPEYETFKRFLNFSGEYELHGFGRYNGLRLKMRSAIDGQLIGLTPIWKNIFTLTDSQYFIFFNQTYSRWELHEMKTYSESSLPFSRDHIFCKTGLTNLFLLFYKKN